MDDSRFTKDNREKKSLVTIGGTALTQSGKITRSDYFRFLGHDLDRYEEIELTPDQAKRIHSHLQKLSTGTAAMVPLYCGGTNICPFADRCPLAKMDKAPIGRQCIIENQLMKEFTIRYVLEFDIDPNNFTEVAYVNELASLDIREMRTNMALARPENAEGIINQVTAIGQDGSPIMQKQLSPYVELLEKIQNRRSKVVKLMVGDRQEKYKKEAALKMKLEADPSSKMAKMRTQLENLQRSMDNLQKEAGGKRQDDVVTPEDIIDAIEDIE